MTGDDASSFDLDEMLPSGPSSAPKPAPTPAPTPASRPNLSSLTTPKTTNESSGYKPTMGSERRARR